MKYLSIIASLAVIMSAAPLYAEGSDDGDKKELKGKDGDELSAVAAALKEMKNLPQGVNLKADFYMFLNLSGLASSLKKTDSDGLFSKELFTDDLKAVKTVRASRKVEALFYHVTDDAEGIQARLKEQRIKYPVLIGSSIKTLLPLDVSSRFSRDVRICIVDKEGNVVAAGGEEVLVFWKEYTIRPMDEKKLSARIEAYQKKKEKEEARAKKKLGSGGGMMSSSPG